jgi:hypothetical protein
MAGKLMTTIVNGIKPELINMKIGNRDFFVPLAAVENSCEYKVELCEILVRELGDVQPLTIAVTLCA